MINLLRARRDANSRPGERPPGDKNRVALLVQGGGMRGVVSAAMLCALDDLGFKQCVDDVYATSAGAMNAAYFLASDTWFPLSIYYDDLASKDFVDFSRPLRKKPIMDLAYAFDEVVRRRKPLDVEAVLRSPTRLHVVLTLLGPARIGSISSFRSGEDLLDTLKASCWLPIATTGTARWRDQRAVDGGVLAPTLEATAAAGGATHALSLHTRADGEPRAGRLGRLYVRRRLNQLEAGLGSAYEAAAAEARRTRARPWEPTSDHLSVLPLPEQDIARHELDPYRLLTAARSAYAVMYAVLEGRPMSALRDGTIQVAPKLTVFDRSVEMAPRGVGSER